MNDTPVFVIEETKTDDSESRNTGVYQRATKFVYLDYFYQNQKISCITFRANRKYATETNIFILDVF